MSTTSAPAAKAGGIPKGWLIAGGLGCLALAGVVTVGVAALAFLAVKGGLGGGTVGGVAQPAGPSFRGGRPVGLYFMTRFWPATGSLEKKVWYFAPDGQVYEDVATGFSAEDLAAHQGRRGQATANGDTMEIAWSGDGKSASKVERDGDGFAWDAGIFVPVKPFERGKGLAGTYEGGESVHGSGGGGVAVSRTLQLRDDGTFTWTGIASFSARSEDSEVSGGGESPGVNGTWKQAGYALVLSDDKGTTIRRIAFPYDDEKTPVYPDRMFFGGLMYKKQS